MYRRAGNLSRDSISADNEKEKYDKAKKSANIVKAINKSEELRTEAKVDKKTPEYKRATVRDKRYGNPYGSLELGGGIRKDRRADHEARRGVKKEEVEIVDERAELKRLNYGNAVVPQRKLKNKLQNQRNLFLLVEMVLLMWVKLRKQRKIMMVTVR